MSEIIFEVVKLVVMLCVMLAARYVIPWVKSRIDAENLSLIEKWAEKAVLKAQQVMQSDSGADKKETVMQFLQEILAEKNITITDEQLDTLIEAAVKQMKIAENSGITITATNETETK